MLMAVFVVNEIKQLELKEVLLLEQKKNAPLFNILLIFTLP